MKRTNKRAWTGRLLGILLCVTLLAGLLPTVGALSEATTTGKGSLKVALSEDTAKLVGNDDVVFTLYQIGDAAPTTTAGWKISSQFSGYEKKLFDAKTPEQLGEVAEAMAKAIAGNASFKGTAQTLSKGEKKYTEFKNLNPGVYLGVMTKGPKELMVTPFIATIPFRDPKTKEIKYDNEVTVKAEYVTEPTLEKKVKDADDTAGTVTGWQDSADYDIGDKVPFQLTATLANNVTKYKTYRITFRDEMEAGLTFNNDVTVTVNGTAVTAKPVQTTNGFDLTLEWKGVGGALIADEKLNGAKVVVEFTATLNSSAKSGSNGTANKSTLYYTNNPSIVTDKSGTPDDTDTPHTPWDTVIVFTYQLVVNKVDGEGKALTGAQFKLEKITADSKTVVQAYSASSSNNTFTFKGLDDGTYVLTETVAPAGYKAIDPITFTVTADHNIIWDGSESTRSQVLKSLTGNVTTGVLTLTANLTAGSLTGDVKNEPVFTEPATGGLTVTKTVNGTNAQKQRQFQFTVTLDDKAINGKYGEMTFKSGVATFSLSDGGKMTATGLPVDVAYTVTETRGDGFTTTSSGTTGKIEANKTSTASFVNTFPTETETTPPGGGDNPPPAGQPTPTPTPTTQVTGTKVWDDESNVHKTRPGSITITLLADGSPVSATPSWSKSGDRWTFTFSDLPAVDGSGATITYTVRETPVDGYTSSVSGLTITNHLDKKEPKEYTEFSGIKTWNDNDNARGLRPTYITVHLLRDGVVVETRTANAGTGWRYDFGRQPVDDGYGNKYTYEVREDAVSGYFARTSGMDLTNTPLEGGTPPVPGDNTPPEGSKGARESVPSRKSATPLPPFEGKSDEEFEELFDLFGYGTPLFGQLLGTGDYTPLYPFIFGGIGALAVILFLVLGRKKKKTR